MPARVRFGFAVLVLVVVLAAFFLPAVPDPVTALRAADAAFAIMCGLGLLAGICAGRLSLYAVWRGSNSESTLLAPRYSEQRCIPLLC